MDIKDLLQNFNVVTQMYVNGVFWVAACIIIETIQILRIVSTAGKKWSNTVLMVLWL